MNSAARKAKTFALSLTALAWFSVLLQLGYARTLLNSLGLLVVFIVLGLLLVALGRARRRMPVLQ